MFESVIIFLLAVIIFYYVKLSADLKKVGLDYDRLDRMFKNLNYTIKSGVKINDELQAEAVKCEKIFSELLDKSNNSIADLKFLISRGERVMDDLENASKHNIEKISLNNIKERIYNNEIKTFEDILNTLDNDVNTKEKV